MGKDNIFQSMFMEKENIYIQIRELAYTSSYHLKH